MELEKAAIVEFVIGANAQQEKVVYAIADVPSHRLFPGGDETGAAPGLRGQKMPAWGALGNHARRRAGKLLKCGDGPIKNILAQDVNQNARALEDLGRPKVRGKGVFLRRCHGHYCSNSHVPPLRIRSRAVALSLSKENVPNEDAASYTPTTVSCAAYVCTGIETGSCSHWRSRRERTRLLRDVLGSSLSCTARLSNSRMRSFALCSCDFEFPTEQSSSSAISWCSYPSTSCSRKIVRYPSGSSLIARASAMRSTEPARRSSRLPYSRRTVFAS